jgi:hypothetical protein
MSAGHAVAWYDLARMAIRVEAGRHLLSPVTGC